MGNQLTLLSKRRGEKFDSLFVLSEQSPGLETIPLILQNHQSLRGLNCISCPKMQRQMTFAAALRPPVHSWREDVSAFTFGSHPALCSKFKLFVFRLLQFLQLLMLLIFFFLNLPRLATSEKQTLYLAEDNIWRCPREGTRIDAGELRGNFKRRPLGLLAFILAPSWAP